MKRDELIQRVGKVLQRVDPDILRVGKKCLAFPDLCGHVLA